MAKKKLSKGFEDLFIQNETDLSFLDTYGETNTEQISGLPESSNDIQFSDELFLHIKKLFKSENLKFKSNQKTLKVENFMTVTNVSGTIKIDINSNLKPLPLVPSDLKAPGFVSSKLSEDNQFCSVVIASWGINSKQLISRMIEFYKLNY
ncbi:MAG: hypothetical protein CMB56_005100 [Methanobacteriota archaeon]|nr:MAG: hypothetical protein CMB56_005100 [Euryarchaeota archaeon]|tara:strand:+ start:7502 stop:7951 length:450 start_codon:yes stop_codon:yes gene_type:complete